jgi:hypothetical protein
MTRYIFSNGKIRVEERMVPRLEPKKQRHALQSAVIILLRHLELEPEAAQEEDTDRDANSQHPTG